MKQSLLIVSVLFLAAGCLAARAASEPVTPPDAVVFNIADTHSAYDAYPAYLAGVRTVVSMYPDSEIVFLFNGDLFEYGIKAALRSEGEADWAFLERLEEMGTVVINIGNHEFDVVSPEDFVARAETLGVRVIGTVGYAGNEELVPAYTDLAVAGAELRIVGVGTDQINTYPKDLRDNLVIPDPVTWMSGNYASAAAGADSVILATHAGLVDDKAMAGSLNAGTLYALGGHDHLTLETALAGVPYVHTGFKAETIHWAEIRGLGTAVPRANFRSVSLDSVRSEDEEMRTLVEDVRKWNLEAEDLEVLGIIPDDMSILDAVDWAVEVVRDAVDADVAFLNHTSFGSGLAAGELLRYEFDTFMRFDNDVMVADVDADTLKTILGMSDQHEMENVASRTGDFLYSSGIDPMSSRRFRIATSSWVALDFNQMKYLGTAVEFEKVPDITTKGLLIRALED